MPLVNVWIVSSTVQGGPKVINLFSKTNGFVKIINLHSKTGLGRSGHVRFQTFGPIWHVSGPEMVF